MHRYRSLLNPLVLWPVILCPTRMWLSGKPELLPTFVSYCTSVVIKPPVPYNTPPVPYWLALLV